MNMTGKSYRDLLRECGYQESTLATMTEDDCEAEYIELALSGGELDE